VLEFARNRIYPKWFATEEKEVLVREGLMQPTMIVTAEKGNVVQVFDRDRQYIFKKGAVVLIDNPSSSMFLKDGIDTEIPLPGGKLIPEGVDVVPKVVVIEVEKPVEEVASQPEGQKPKPAPLVLLHVPVVSDPITVKQKPIVPVVNAATVEKSEASVEMSSEGKKNRGDTLPASGQTSKDRKRKGKNMVDRSDSPPSDWKTVTRKNRRLKKEGREAIVTLLSAAHCHRIPAIREGLEKSLGKGFNERKFEEACFSEMMSESNFDGRNWSGSWEYLNDYASDDWFVEVDVIPKKEGLAQHCVQQTCAYKGCQAKVDNPFALKQVFCAFHWSSFPANNLQKEGVNPVNKPVFPDDIKRCVVPIFAKDVRVLNGFKCGNNLITADRNHYNGDDAYLRDPSGKKFPLGPVVKEFDGEIAVYSPKSWPQGVKSLSMAQHDAKDVHSIFGWYQKDITSPKLDWYYSSTNIANNGIGIASTQPGICGAPYISARTGCAVGIHTMGGNGCSKATLFEPAVRDYCQGPSNSPLN
jgi:hypothetical protein